MTARDFCFWLQGFFEIRGDNVRGPLEAPQVEVIRNHLALVFKHEIDPSIDGGEPEAAAALDAIHRPRPPGRIDPNPGVVYRC